MKRFWNKVAIAGPNDCWEWQASFHTTGYGQIRFNHKKWTAHRVSWILINGEIPDALCVLHKCDNRKCVNPKHLFLGTNYDNMKDKTNKGRHHNQIKTHCKYGHEFNEKNTATYGKQKQCKVCSRSRALKRYHKLKEMQHA